MFYDWLSIESLNGSVLSGNLLNNESISFEASVNSGDLPEGSYNADIIILTNSEDLNIPVFLEVSETFSLPGDINLDGTVNVTDVVSLVNLILSGQSNSSSDINGDDLTNITDIITLIDFILNG